mgnify:CR=1 FL=1
MIIALTGKKRCGKTSVANALCERASTAGTFTKINFKSALLKQAKEHFPDFLAAEATVTGVTVDQLLEDKPRSIRQFLQNYGTDLFRTQDKDYWTNKWRDSVIGYSNVVVDDLRFLNEAQAVKDLGGTIIRIVRPSLGEQGDTHASEMEMDAIQPDYTITNDDIETVISEVKRVLNLA